MKILICQDAAHAVDVAARQVSQYVCLRPQCVLGLATGGTMEALYGKLVEDHRQHNVNYASVKTFNLDEYVGLNPEHIQSYHHYMQQHFFQHINILGSNTHLPLGSVKDVEEEAVRYEHLISQLGGIDLQLLGIGENGHIGFNEPSSSLASRTRIKRLTRSTIAANQRFFSSTETPPSYALTMGIATILEARKIVVLVTGAHKSKAVSQTVEGPISARWPGSILQMHAHTCVVLDREAAQDLELRDYYLDVHPTGTLNEPV